MRRKREVLYDFKLGEAGEAATEAAEAAEDSEDEVMDVAPTFGSDDLFTNESRTLMLQHLLQKGFCLVGLGGTHQPMVDAARLDALKLLQEDDGANFIAPPFMVADGLLGEEGSAEIMQLENFNYAAQQKPGLGSADAFLTQIYTAVSPLDSMLECRFSSRSTAILHKAGIPKDSDVPELTAKDCHKWLGTFGHSRLMLVLFLGPGYGRMEFQPLDADMDPIELDVGPQTLLLLRADGLSHRFFSTGRSLALSCFLMEDAAQTWRRRFGTPLLVTPVCRELMDWAKERWEQSRKNQPIGDEGQELDPHMPREWQKMASQVFQLGPQVAVRGTSCKFPASYSDAGFWCGAEAGCDLIEEVPLCRWDHSKFYDEDLDSFKWCKTSCQHASFIDGIELFDNKFFGISPAESKGMDPMQRHILETSYEALYFSGFQKKTLMRSLIGVYVGASTSEFAFAPQEDCSMSGTGGANSITSNRISFCLGMQGPSFTMDAQGAASLAALTTAAMSLRFQTELYKPNHAALVGGVYLMLAGTTWLLYSAKGQLSPVGRCFSFDQSADGFVKSEGVANLVLTLLNEAEDAEVTMNGIIAATHTNHTGHTASLTAPCGPQQGELIQQALRQAAISPTTVDAVECFSHGRYMQDAVEAEVAKRTLRGYDANEMPLSLSSGFTSSGMSMEAAGMMQILRVLVTQKYGTILPSLHLQQLNPYIEEPNDQESALFATEHLQLEGLSSYHGITGQSLGGTMCHVITLGNRQVENEQPPSNETPQEHVTTREAQQLAASKFWLPKTIG